MATKKKAKIHKARVVNVRKLDVDKHLIAAEYEVHAPEEALPEFTGEPIEITPDAPPETPAGFWHNFFKNW